VKNQKPKNIKEKVKAWIARQKLNIKLWIYQRLVLVALGFIGLNAVDGYMTNYVQQTTTKIAEANPFLAPVVGHWVLNFKGILGLAAIGAISWVRKIAPDRVFWILLFGCLVILCIIVWNMHTMGLIG
jgi:hypothetical protein